MDRPTNRMRILALALLLLAPAGAPVVPEAATASSDSQVRVMVVADNTSTPATPKSAHPPRAPRSSRPAPETPTPAEAPDTPDAPDAPDAELSVPAPPVMFIPRGYFGFSMEGATFTSARGESAAVWRFKTRPAVYQVEPNSPAWRAGIRRGDVVLQMDGIAIQDPMAGRRLGSVKPGQVVRWTVLRDGEKREMVATAGMRPGSAMRVQIIDLERELRRIQEQADGDEMRKSLEDLERQMQQTRARETIRVRPSQSFRYAGVIGPAEVEVRGDEPVTMNSNDNEMVITIGNSVVRIRIPDASTKRKSESPNK